MEMNHPLWVDVRGTFLKSCSEIFEAQHFPAWGVCVCVKEKEN